jgi:SAM-dependent methyltransferase
VGAPFDGRSQSTRPLYERYAWAYDVAVARPAGVSVEQAAAFASLGVGADSLIVDAGCATGRYAAALADAGFRVIGVDRSAALLEQARSRTTSAVFVHADFLRWRPHEPADGVLCRGVLNDLISDDDRRAAIEAFAAWLCVGDVLLADVREWTATAARYANAPHHTRSASQPGRRLEFTSHTTLDPERRLLLLRERYVGSVDGADMEESHDFLMRCWTAEELRDRCAAAGFTSIRLQAGAEAGIAEDRMLLTARK